MAKVAILVKWISVNAACFYSQNTSVFIKLCLILHKIFAYVILLGIIVFL